MRKIASRKNKEKKEKRNQLIIGLILIGVIVFGIIGGSFQGLGNKNSSKKIEYNGFEFVEQNGFWILNINENNFIFDYNPEEVEKISGYLMPLNNYFNKPVYISSENNAAELEIYKNIDPFALRVRRACLDEKECEGNLPIKTCENNFIIIRKGDYSNITQEENCVFIEGKQEDLVKLADEFLFKILGVEE